MRRHASLLTMLALAATSAARAVAQVPSLPDTPAIGKIYPVRTDGANRGVRITVNNAAKVARYGPLKAPAGRAFLVVSTTWENIIPLTYVAEQNDPKATAYKTPNVADHVYLVLNGRTVARLSAIAGNTPGHLPVTDLTIAKAGDQLKGNLIFDIPADAKLGWAELRYIDSIHGSLAVPMGDPATEAAAKAPAKPINSPVANDVLEAGAYAIEKGVEGPRPPPPGMQYVRLDFRAKSMVTTPPPAPRNGVPPAKPGVTVADWPDAYKYVSLLVDSEYSYAPIVAPGTMAGSPRFLPEIATGGALLFLVPEKPKSIELRCVFPGAVVNSRTVRPRPLDIAVEGYRPPKANLKPIVPPMVDDLFFTAVTNVETAATFAGQPAGDSKQWLVVSITVANTGKDGEYFQPREQLKFVTAAGEQQAMDPLAADGPRAPAEPLWIPNDERRSFQAVYRIAADEPVFRLAYSGITKGGMITLPGGTGKGTVETAKTPTTAPAIAPTIARADDSPAAEAARPPAPAPTPRKILAPTEPLVRQTKKYPSRIAARQSLTPKGIEGVGLKPEQVNAAIDRGAAALWKRIKDRLDKYERNRLGDEREDLIASLALVHANWHKKDPSFDAALRGMLAKYDPNQQAGTYENGIVCMIIEGLGDTSYVPKLASTAQWLVDEQGPMGTWNYGKRLDTNEEAGGAAGPRKVLSVVGGRPPEDSARGTQPLNRRTASIDFTDGDNSASQYAMLGLHSAARSGFELPKDLFNTFLTETRDRQNEDGGWAYHGYGSTSYGSMTCAGICAVALSRFNLGEKEPWKDESVERGLAWLNAYFQVDDHPQSAHQWVYYYLYSLERVGRILDTEFIGDHEWYPLGARWLVDKQKPTGLWFNEAGNEGENEAEIPTSFALLFLTRATASLGERVIPQGPGTLKTAALLPPGNRLYVILDCSGSMLEQIDGREKFEIAKDAVRAMIKDMPDNSDVALRAYGYRLRAIQPGASEDTKLLVPLKTLDRKEMAGFLDGLRCRGKTPMALSLEQAAADLRGAASPEKPITAVLLTDGGEDTQPRKDPVKAAALFNEIENVSLHIVGFDINRDDWSQQLKAMADAARTPYLPAAKAAELQQELRSAVFGIPESCDVLDAAGKPIKTLAFGQPLTLEPGKYQFATTFAGQQYTESFYISPGETTAITFDSAAIAAEANAAKSSAKAAEAATAKAAEAAAKPAAETPAEKPVAKFCKNCGFPLKAGAKFCTHCGAKVGE